MGQRQGALGHQGARPAWDQSLGLTYDEPEKRPATARPVDDRPGFPCSDCSKLFRSIEAVERHRQAKHGRGARTPSKARR